MTTNEQDLIRAVHSDLLAMRAEVRAALVPAHTLNEESRPTVPQYVQDMAKAEADHYRAQWRSVRYDLGLCKLLAALLLACNLGQLAIIILLS